MKKPTTESRRVAKMRARYRARIKSLEQQVDTLHDQMKKTVSVNQHNAGSHRASEVAFLRMERVADALRIENERMRQSLPVHPLPPLLPRNPSMYPQDYEPKKIEKKEEWDDVSKPVPGLVIPQRIDVDQPLEQQWKDLEKPKSKLTTAMPPPEQAALK